MLYITLASSFQKLCLFSSFHLLHFRLLFALTDEWEFTAWSLRFSWELQSRLACLYEYRHMDVQYALFTCVQETWRMNRRTRHNILHFSFLNSSSKLHNTIILSLLSSAWLYYLWPTLLNFGHGSFRSSNENLGKKFNEILTQQKIYNLKLF